MFRAYNVIAELGDIGGWPTFAVFAKVGTHAACVGDFPFATPDVIVPTFTQNVKVGQPALYSNASGASGTVKTIYGCTLGGVWTVIQ